MSLTRTQAEAVVDAIVELIRADHRTPAADDARDRLVEALVGRLPQAATDEPDPLDISQAGDNLG